DTEATAKGQRFPGELAVHGCRALRGFRASIASAKELLCRRKMLLQRQCGLNGQRESGATRLRERAHALDVLQISPDDLGLESRGHVTGRQRSFRRRKF